MNKTAALWKRPEAQTFEGYSLKELGELLVREINDGIADGDTVRYLTHMIAHRGSEYYHKSQVSAYTLRRQKKAELLEKLNGTEINLNLDSAIKKVVYVRGEHGFKLKDLTLK